MDYASRMTTVRVGNGRGGVARTALLTGLLTAAAVLGVAAPAPAAKTSYPFAFGTYKGTLSTGGGMTVRLRKASCFLHRQVATYKTGACLRIDKLDVQGGACPDGTTVEPTLAAYLQDHEEIHLAGTGRYSDVAETSFGQGRTITATTIRFRAQGRRITGTIRITGSQESDLAVPCATVSATYTLKLR